MLFKNPNLLYGLLFLLIPIIVHLFQLRKFKKVAFTNVAFLEPLITQTRKSRTLKKWLTLITRLLAIAAIVFAFAQPFFPTESGLKLDENLVIYLDNSNSLQAKGTDGRLYQAAVNDLIEKLPSGLSFSLFTNVASFQNVTKQEIANELLSGSYSSAQLSPEQVLLKADSFRPRSNDNISFIWISDFQRSGNSPFVSTDKAWNTRFVKLIPVEYQNISIDSAFISMTNDNDHTIQLSLSSNFDEEQPVTISFFNDDLLVAKTSASLKDQRGEASFALSDINSFKGTIQIEDDGLQFDNRLFISSNTREKISVLHINNTENDFLKRIYTGDEFDYTTATPSNVNYNSIKNQQVVVINELEVISPALAKELNDFTIAGNTLIIIPSSDASGYEALNGLRGSEPSVVEKRITGINFDHPILQNVFSQRVTNFQYPKVSSTAFQNAGGNSILSFDDGSSFLSQFENTFLFASPLNEENSNFQNSPLIVPVFYKMGLRNTSAGVLYYPMSQRNEISFPKSLQQDQILELQLDNDRIIPEQRAYNSFVTIVTGAEINHAANYDVMLKDESIAYVSFNASRIENQSDYYSDEEIGAPVLSEIGAFVQELNGENNRLELWKWFVAGALFFLICELMILKFLK
ncbi:BatA domain-containing protein [Nonlabens agnitus]|uniref:Aerotolerance regulator N-terminal domain-containing protein n=1 Tax=Nonlabens agnitus TaxID=870484 RepID=A0A2S9WTS5_9FLAO|nr:BatA domain-containing protein [Nonlabens agnitus]PRP66716.1 hypothetical protein BST86_06185 [Nonlabens agnitus]